MPLRNPDVLAGVVGFLVVVLLLGLRVDVRQTAQRGPRWLRRVLTAGLAVLGLLGMNAPVAAEPGAQTQGQERDMAAETLNSFPEGKELLKIWAEAEDVGSGARGDYPFDRAGKEALLKELARAEQLIDALVTKGCFGEAEGGLLKVDLRRAKTGVEKKRTTEMMDATCYKPMMLIPGVDALDRLEARLPLLEKLKPGTLSPSVARKLRETIERDLNLVQEKTPEWFVPNEETRQRLQKMRQRIPEIVEKLEMSPGNH